MASRLAIFITDKLPCTVPVLRTTLLFWYLCVRHYVRPYVRMYDISTPLQNSTVLPDCYRMDRRDCNHMYWREHSIGPFVHNLLIDFK